jgi:hypothetical protein
VHPVDLRQRVISLIGVRDVSGRIEVRSITRALAVPEVEGARRTDLVAELVDEQGETMAAAPVLRLVSHGGCGCGGGCDEDDERGPYLFQAFLPDVGRGGALRLVEGGKELWSYSAPREEPKPPVLEARVSKQGQLTVRWRVPKSERPLEIWIRWRPSRAAEPQVLFVASGSGRRQVSAAALPAGNVILDAVAHDGFSEAVSEPVEIRLPRRAPEVAILHPVDRLTIQAGRPLRLHGAATEPGGEHVAPERCVWRIDRKQVANGLDVFVPAPPAGDHTVTLTATGTGGRGEARARLTTVDPEGDAERRARERG